MVQGWNVEQARKTYAIGNWGSGYFDINEAGHVVVTPKKQLDQRSIDLYELAQKFRQEGISFPVLARFRDILCHRVQHLREAFAQAFADHAYNGGYTPVYPIKVNQQSAVVEAIMDQPRVAIGLEAGSKPELLAVLALAKHGLVICNGYKDRAYIRLALVGVSLGLNIYIVIEKSSELDLILTESQALGIEPRLGVRLRLASISAGKWQNTGGMKAKFGLGANDLLGVVETLRDNGNLNSLKVMHFHVGSQVTNIHDIRTAVKEAARHYAELRRLGANIDYVDAGGGLGVDYEGSGSRNACSMNYTTEEYAHALVSGFKEICDEADLPQPNLATEAGRAMTAHHAVLITNVVDVETVVRDEVPQPSVNNQTHLRHGQHKSILELYHNADFALSEARAMYLQGKLGLSELATANLEYTKVCSSMRKRLDVGVRAHREVLDELNEQLADKVFCNFSVFQSMPDIWGIQQIFPLMPIHRLEQEPTRRAIIQDLTCDSDGRIDSYVDGQSIEKTIPLHPWRKGQDYLIGFFLVGAYQEVLGDKHNLFGDTHSVNVELDDSGGYRLVEPLRGDDVRDLLNYVNLNPEGLFEVLKVKLDNAPLSSELKSAVEKLLSESLNAYSYLET